MPRDVVLGEGYEGDVMVTPVAPGQHVGHYNVQDGSSSLLQQEEDAGLGHRGRHRHRGWGRGGPWWGGPVYYEPLYVEDITARRPFILDDDSDEAKAKRLEAKLKLKKLEEEAKAKGLKGLGDAAMPCIQRIIAAAAVGAREAIKGVETGVLKDLRDVCEHIRRRVCAEVQSHHAMYAKAVSQAVQTAFAEAKPHVEKLLAQKRGVNGLGQGIVQTFFGPGQAYYNALTQAQNKAIAIQAEISGIGKDVWDSVMRQNTSAFAAGGWSPVSNYSYENMMGFWLAQSKRLLSTASKQPPESDIKDVMYLAGGTDKMIALVKSLAPSNVAAQAEADRRDMEARLEAMGPIKSPSDVARQTLVEEVQKRAGVFGGVSAVMIGVIAAGLFAAWQFMGRR